MAKTAESGSSWRRSSMARMARDGCRWGIDEKNIRTGGLHAAHDGSEAATGKVAQVWTCCHTGAIDQHLEHGALFIVGGHDDDREFGHKRVLLLN